MSMPPVYSARTNVCRTRPHFSHYINTVGTPWVLAVRQRPATLSSRMGA